MEVIEIFAIFGSPNVGKYTYLNTFLNDQKPKDLINRPIKWVIPFCFSDEEDEILSINIYHDRMLNETIGALVIFDVTDINSFYESVEIINQIVSQYKKLHILWIGNKVDKGDRIVKKRDVLKRKKQFQHEKYLKYREISAKDSDQVYKSFDVLLNMSCQMELLQFETSNMTVE